MKNFLIVLAGIGAAFGAYFIFKKPDATDAATTTNTTGTTTPNVNIAQNAKQQLVNDKQQLVNDKIITAGTDLGRMQNVYCLSNNPLRPGGLFKLSGTDSMILQSSLNTLTQDQRMQALNMALHYGGDIEAYLLKMIDDQFNAANGRAPLGLAGFSFGNVNGAFTTIKNKLNATSPVSFDGGYKVQKDLA